MKVTKLWTHSSAPLLDINKDMTGYIEHILKEEDIPATILFAEKRQDDPLWGHKKRYGWFGSEETVQVGSVPKKQVYLTMEYHEARHIEIAWHDFKRIQQIMSPIEFWNPYVILDGMSFLTGKWNISPGSHHDIKITDQKPSDNMKATVTLFGFVDSDEMRQELASIADQLYEPVKTGRHLYTTTYDDGSCTSYPPQIKLSKSWEGFDEIAVFKFFQKVQEFSKHHRFMEKWSNYPHHMISPDDEYLEVLYTIDLSKKTRKAEKTVRVGHATFDCPILEVEANIWRNSVHNNGARCFFLLRHEPKMTAYRP